ncbi:PstS family phosphate ABC transporter substrate-binding protein [Singulisphaera sp. Ch08]|uniref:Phosphate-binding protein n=1 Tax=Singulisphaera sp. Ch08 TaxID=3120278 RepID=A0AAU7CNZ0_9BACT
MRHERSARLQAATLVAMILVGCGGDGESPSGASATVDIDGSSTVFRISEAAREAYSAVNPNVTVVVDNHGTGGGFGHYLAGEIDIVDASRPANADEEAKAKAQGIPWTRFNVGTDGITVVVNPENQFVKSLTVAQLKAIWEPNSKVMTWKDLDPSWPARTIVFYSPDQDSGTFDFFTEVIVGKAKQQRDDVQPSSDDNTLVNGVAGDVDGLGYFGHAYFEANSNKLRAIPIQNGAAAPVMPSEATILDESYTPLSRPLFIYVKNASIRRPAVFGFLKYYLEHIEELAKKGGYVPPTSKTQEANQKALSAGGDASAPTAKDAA